MKPILNHIRSEVSRDRIRYEDDGYNLDLTYITDQVIAMAFPASGLEAAWRNHIDEVSQLLRTRHGSSFKIWNLSERSYDYAKFNHQIEEFPFEDHHNPPLTLLVDIVLSLHGYLRGDRSRAAAIHCVGGKGRTGTVICAYMMYTGLFSNPKEAFKFFALKRSAIEKGVTQPSQRRYVHYFNEVLTTHVVPRPKPLVLIRIIMKGIPVVTAKGCNPEMHVYDQRYMPKNFLFSTCPQGQRARFIHSNEGAVVWPVDNCVIFGDVLFKLFHSGKNKAKKLMHFALHTAFLTEGTLSLPLEEMDDVQMELPRPRDKRESLGPKQVQFENFSVMLEFAAPAEHERRLFESERERDLARRMEESYRLLFESQPMPGSQDLFKTNPLQQNGFKSSQLYTPSPPPVRAHQSLSRAPSVSEPPRPAFDTNNYPAPVPSSPTASPHTLHLPLSPSRRTYDKPLPVPPVSRSCRASPSATSSSAGSFIVPSTTSPHPPLFKMQSSYDGARPEIRMPSPRHPQSDYQQVAPLSAQPLSPGRGRPRNFTLMSNSTSPPPELSRSVSPQPTDFDPLPARKVPMNRRAVIFAKDDLNFDVAQVIAAQVPSPPLSPLPPPDFAPPPPPPPPVTPSPRSNLAQPPPTTFISPPPPDLPTPAVPLHPINLPRSATSSRITNM